MRQLIKQTTLTLLTILSTIAATAGNIITLDGEETVPSNGRYYVMDTINGWHDGAQTHIFSSENHSETYSYVPVAATQDSTEDNMTIENVSTEAGGTFDLVIGLNNTKPYTEIGGYIALPEGMTFATNNKGKYLITLDGDRLPGHIVSAQIQENGDLKFVIVNMEGEPVEGNSGTIMKVTVNVSEDMVSGDYEVIMHDLQLSDGNLYEIADAKATVVVVGKEPISDAYTLTALVTPAGTGTVNMANIHYFEDGDKVELVATPATDCTFLYWAEGETKLSENSSFTYTMPNRDVTLTAHFKYGPSNPEDPEMPGYGGKVANPTFSLDGNGKLTIATTTANASIYYGFSSDTTAFVKYNGAVQLTDNRTVYAIARATGYDPSDVVDYKVDMFKCGSVQFSFSEPRLTMSTGTDGATIHYIIDGTESVYSPPVDIIEPCKVFAYATKENFNRSDTTFYETLIPQHFDLTLFISS